MRTIVDLPDKQLEALKAIGEREGLSRAELMRRAVAEYLARHPSARDDAAFGLWQKRGEDGLRYQARIREEWDES